MFESNDGYEVSIPGEVTLSVSTDQIGDSDDVKLWRLNSLTGEWHFESNITKSKCSGKRSKRDEQPESKLCRSCTIRSISCQIQLTFARESDRSCYSKVRVHRKGEHLEGATVSVIVHNPKDRTSFFLSRVRPDGDGDGSNGYCVAHQCKQSKRRSEKPFKGWIFADYDNKEVLPVDPLENLKSVKDKLNLAINSAFNRVITVGKIDETLVKNGPFYKYDHESSCVQAGDSDNYFKFDLELPEKERTGTPLSTGTYTLLLGFIEC